MFNTPIIEYWGFTLKPL